MARTVKATLLIEFFDGDPAKAGRLRGLLRAKQMIRRDTNGAVIVDNLLDNGPGGGPPVAPGGRP